MRSVALLVLAVAACGEPRVEPPAAPMQPAPPAEDETEDDRAVAEAFLNAPGVMVPTTRDRVREPSIRDLGTVPIGDMAGQASRPHPGVVEHALRSQVRLELVDTSGAGTFDSNIVTRTARARLAAIRRCYERELRSERAPLAGTALVRFTIVPEGRVTNATVAETDLPGPVASCALRTVMRFRFNPGPEGGAVSFGYRFHFSADPPA